MASNNMAPLDGTYPKGLRPLLCNGLAKGWNRALDRVAATWALITHIHNNKWQGIFEGQFKIGSRWK